MKIRLKNNWFDPNGARRRTGIIYEVPDSFEDQLPSGTEVLSETNDVEYVVDRKMAAEVKQTISVDVTADKDAQATVSKTTEAKKDEKPSVKL